MPFATNNGVRIRYEVLGNGHPLVMVHGGTVGLEMWQELGYTNALCAEPDGCRLILIDARGHGQSDKPHDTAHYKPELMAGDVVTVLDALGMAKAHYMGVSLGAAVGFEIARYVPDRFLSLALLGYGRYGPLTEAEQQFAMAGLGLFDMGAKMGGAAVISAIEGMGGSLSPVMRAAYLTNDWEALFAFQTAFIGWPGFEDTLPLATTPSLVLAAESDPFHGSAAKCAEKMPDATFVSLAGGGHNQGSYPPEMVVPHVKALIRAAMARG